MMVEYRIVEAWPTDTYGLAVRKQWMIERRLGGTDTWMPVFSTVRGETAAREMLSAMLSPDRAVVAEFDFNGREVRKVKINVKNKAVFEVVDPQGQVLGEYDTYTAAQIAAQSWRLSDAV